MYIIILSSCRHHPHFYRETAADSLSTRVIIIPVKASSSHTSTRRMMITTRLSTITYLYKRRGCEKLFFGPIWDCDKGWNNDKRVPHYEYQPLESLMIHAGFWMPPYVSNDWFQRLWTDSSTSRIRIYRKSFPSFVSRIHHI